MSTHCIRFGKIMPRSVNDELFLSNLYIIPDKHKLNLVLLKTILTKMTLSTQIKRNPFTEYS